MSTVNNCYKNPRLDGHNDAADACTATVYADVKKIMWMAPMMILGTIGSAYTASYTAIILFLITTAVSLCLGHSLGMHRRFIHRSYACPKWMEYLFVHFGVLVGLAGLMGMLTTHDLRDWAQRQDRCHDYFTHQQVWYRDLWWQIFCSIELINPPRLKLEQEIEEDRVYRFMERSWQYQQIPWVILFYFCGGWSWVFWGICTRVTVSVCGHWLIGYLAHNSGSRSWYVPKAAVQGYNVPWSTLLTMGECWHNNHHAFPESAKFGIEKGQWDPGWWVLLALKKIGLVSSLVTEKSIKREMQRYSPGVNASSN